MMNRPPLILVSPSMEKKGVEFFDSSISLSNRYTDAIITAGGLPQIMPSTGSPELIAEMVRRSDGVLLTGGDDIQPEFYDKNMPPELVAKVGALEPERDVWESLLIKEIFAQRKPLLSICRGHQMVNVALGGTLIVDIPTQMPGALNHRQMERKTEPVHDIAVEPDSLLAQITGEKILGVNSTHHQAVDKLADKLQVSARSSDGVIEALELKDKTELPFFLAMQFHPERLIDRHPVFLRVFKRFVTTCAENCGNTL